MPRNSREASTGEQRNKYDPSDIFNMDETGLFYASVYGPCSERSKWCQDE
ncbi:BZ3500_MvSof-1268-A1-R1_Chr4-2g06888 [Microbotryum saponariae]|uniref:BZ3500_MvSof-1268-A1-R1_Chr4-2g06888 protein n=1 Tax=Microbotryum saponariae TaxID=289078 RepID=A0A2X0LL97_9BASI|nr:BZ3500_MvSof-1268-A1-R1_Chr4-2g06888 [Microbotryum saponariae]SDA06553.1 BZ3501_MvSof-1269-A2-R1_Chr4-2g06599 [Microbotryum saponariae]